MAIKSIVEMKAKPGRRDELLSTLQQMSAVDAPDSSPRSTTATSRMKTPSSAFTTGGRTRSVWPGHSRSTPARGNS
jgi:hypothetical protein